MKEHYPSEFIEEKTSWKVIAGAYIGVFTLLAAVVFVLPLLMGIWQ